MERYTFQQCIEIVKFTTKMHENKPEFHRKIIMSDEVHFYLRGSLRLIFSKIKLERLFQ